MAKVKFINPIKALHGKVHSSSDTVYVTDSVSGQVSTRTISKRDLALHPITEREKATHIKMQNIVAEYQRIKANPEVYAQLMQEWNNAPADKKSSSLYHYFMKTRLDEGKNNSTIKAAKKGSNEDSYVQGMQRCKNLKEADRLLVMFVEKLGYKKLAEAYKKIRFN